MNWQKANKEKLQKIQAKNLPHKSYFLYLSPKLYIPNTTVVNDEYWDGDKDIDCEVLCVEVKEIPSTFELNQLLLKLQEEYDKSKDVNYFMIDGQKCWLDKDTRVGLTNSITIQKNSGMSVTTLWLNGKSYQVDIDYILNFLKELELYAIACYNVTQTHLAEIRAINNRDELFKYNISDGYPEALQLNIK